ncbi:protease inhibitor I42 family protein [Streptomyces griseosporeus]|uniref:protease inhibitor I42 family protein n=1 Tax=Streptomyces griseosporeus TaxID=1910 RepID=UPI0036FC4C82
MRRRIRRLTAAAALLLPLTAGCDDDPAAPARYGPADTRITAHVGDRFEIAVQANASTREEWHLVAPGPSAPVVRDRGSRTETDPGTEEMDGAPHTVVFTFEAAGPGSARIVLLHCTFAAPCDGRTPVSTPTPTATATPPASPAPGASATPRPERRVYTVTVG